MGPLSILASEAENQEMGAYMDLEHFNQIKDIFCFVFPYSLNGKARISTMSSLLLVLGTHFTD